MEETGLSQVQRAAPTEHEIVERLAALSTGYQPDNEHDQETATYYDYPVLKQPFWGWEITWYFFLGDSQRGAMS